MKEETKNVWETIALVAVLAQLMALAGIVVRTAWVMAG